MKTKSELFKTNLIYFILMVSFVSIRLLMSLDVLFFRNEVFGYFVNLFVQVGIMFLLPLFLYSIFNKQSGKKTFSDFKFKKINFTSVLISIGIGICVYVLNMGVATFFSVILSALGYNPNFSSQTVEATWGLFALNMLFTAVLPAFCEEFSHRGLLFKGLSSLGTKKAIIISSVCFGLMHLNVSQFFYATVIGAILAIITLCSGSIFPAMIVHFMNNAINVYLPFAKAKDLPFGSLFEKASAYLVSGGIFMTALVTMIVFAVFGLLLFLLVKALFKQTYGKRFEKIRKETALEVLKDELLNDGTSEQQKPQALPFSGLMYDEQIEIDGIKRIVRVRLPLEKMGLAITPTRKGTFFEKIFLYGVFCLGAIVTVSTFIWGVVA
ncbi:MAG: type II CAAX endopeptidase family protein [Clostridia bacterium]